MERRSITIRGRVQGVGFRPFVHKLASRLNLSGFVTNQTGSVRIEIEGEGPSLDQFLSLLLAEQPALARIEQLSWELQPYQGEQPFYIKSSEHHQEFAAAVCPDAATCNECLRELFDPRNRRYRYPFINCTHCGPRLTIVTGVPYDRQRTTMVDFPMCLACQAEYIDPLGRRFHAQAIACPACGPQIWAANGSGTRIQTEDPLGQFAAALQAGRIGAMKGLGGYHLICDARNASAVAELRSRKAREEKPFAIMVRDCAAVEALCEISPLEKECLQAWQRPILLLRKLQAAALADPVAPGCPHLGVMLPYTPLHHLLMEAINGIPLVMTSGNRCDEPIAYENEEAQERLRSIADLFIHHDRPIRVRCDDSVIRVVAAREQPIRRSRGYAPQPIPLPVSCSVPLLALGGQLKATFAVGQERQAILSQHLGDLDDYAAYRQFEKDIGLYERLFEVRPRVLVHDLHPDYGSTRYALRRQAQENIPCIAVQHHHAHLASCLVDNELTEPAIGVIFDGAGWGTDGTIWGGEFLIGDFAGFQRAAHLRPVGLPGGDQAAREPWRMAASYLREAGLSAALLEGAAPPRSLRLIDQMLQRRMNVPLTTSVGRLFDAVASLAGVRHRVSYEGQAAMELEALATGTPPDHGYPFELIERTEGQNQIEIVETRPLIHEIVRDIGRGVGSAIIARRFHSTLVDIISVVCGSLRRRSGLATVALSGGVFSNALLTTEVTERLTDEGFRVVRHHHVPPNDGGLSLGQLAIAAVRIAGGA